MANPLCPKTERERDEARAELAELREWAERLEQALRRIADAESGQWGWVAHEALRESPVLDAPEGKE